MLHILLELSSQRGLAAVSRAGHSHTAGLMGTRQRPSRNVHHTPQQRPGCHCHCAPRGCPAAMAPHHTELTPSTDQHTWPCPQSRPWDVKFKSQTGSPALHGQHCTPAALAALHLQLPVTPTHRAQRVNQNPGAREFQDRICTTVM